jgi:hypothetical protein
MKLLLLLCNLYFVGTVCAIEYKASNFKPLSHIRKCQSGGTIFKSSYYNIAHLFKQFHESHPTCSSKIKKPYGNVKEQIQKLNIASSLYAKDGQCPEMAKVSSEYLKRYRDTSRKINMDKVSLIQAAKEAAKETNIQVENSHLAWNFLMCASSHTSSDLQTRTQYIKELQELVFTTAPAKVSTNGEVVSDCHNVLANGSDDLGSFYVDMKNASNSQFDISYNTFSVPDQIQIFDSKNNLLLDSTCTGTSVNIDRTISVPTYEDKKIKIAVDGKCSDKDSSTYWEMHISCGSINNEITQEERKRRDSCNEKTISMISKLKTNINQMIKVQENEWMHAICQKQHYAQVMPKLTDPLSYLMPYTNVEFSGLNWDFNDNYDFVPLTHNLKTQKLQEVSKKNKSFGKYSIAKIKDETLKKLGLLKDTKHIVKQTLKEMKKESLYKNNYNRLLKEQISLGVYELLGKENPEQEDRFLASVAPLKKHEITPFHYGYNDFIRKKHKYCPNRPDKNESIFKTISYAYCNHGYPRLFDIEDDEF